MLDCSRMSHRVHTILSILAEDHAPAALRPSILLAIDWPTVAEEAPATGDDSYIAYVAAGLLGGRSTRDSLVSSLGAIASLAARLATVAASLTATGDKVMSTHAAALWGAAAALAGMSNTAAATANPAGWDGLINGIASLTHVLPFCSRADEMLDIVMRWHGAENALGALANKASNIIPGAKHTNLGDRATLIATALDRVTHWRAMVQARDTALGALGWDGAENLQAWTAHQKATLENIRDALGACTGETAMGAAVRVAEGYKSFESAHAELCARFRDEGALVNTQIINERDKALADIHALRDILKVPEGGNLVDHASAFAERHMRRVDEATAEASRMHAENTRLRAQVDRMIAAMREDAPAPVKACPQPGDVVLWAEVEDGCLYAKDWGGCRFVMVTRGERSVASGPEDRDIETFLLQRDVLPPAGEKEMTLVARNLGADPEAWRRAMREWTASESSRPR